MKYLIGTGRNIRMLSHPEEPTTLIPEIEAVLIVQEKTYTQRDEQEIQTTPIQEAIRIGMNPDVALALARDLVAWAAQSQEITDRVSVKRGKRTSKKSEPGSE